MTNTRDIFTAELLRPIVGECSGRREPAAVAAKELDTLLTDDPLNKNPPGAIDPPGDGNTGIPPPPSRGVEVTGFSHMVGWWPAERGLVVVGVAASLLR